MRICVVIPMYNEELIAGPNTETILSYTKELPCTVTVLVVNDGSQDATPEILRKLQENYKNNHFQLISHPHNKGYGAALRTGIKFASDNNYDYIIFMDSDLTNHPKYLHDFYEKIQLGYEYIKATRYAAGGKAEGVPFFHKIVSFMGNNLARILYGLPLTDITNGFRAVKVDILKKINLKENGFAIIVEELYWAKSLTRSFCEIPYTLTSRKKGQGITHFSYSPAMCLRYLKYALKSFFITQH